MKRSTNSAGVGSALASLPSKPVEAAQSTGTGEESAYLPSGSFVQGILLSGLDAPAGVTASKEPHPVLIKLSDLAKGDSPLYVAELEILLLDDVPLLNRLDKLL